MATVNKINHIAIVVSDMERSLAFWQGALGIHLHEIKDVTAEASKVAFLPIGGAEIELVLPTTEDSGIAKYLAKRGQGMHHLCIEVDDVTGMLEHLRSQQVRLINDEPRTTNDGKKYAFIHPESTGGVLVELYQVVG